MKPYLVFLFLILSIPVVVGTGFSPSSLVYNLGQNEEECQKVSLKDVSEEIEVINVWAENTDVEWKVGNFDTDASEHGLTVTYSMDETEDGKKIDVCLSGSQSGEYHGAIVFRQEQEGTSIVQLAVWLKAIIEKSQEQTPQLSSGGGSSGGGGSGGTVTPVVKETEKENAEFEELSAEANPEQTGETDMQKGPGITGDAINDASSLDFVTWRIVPVLFIAGLLIALVFVKRKKREFK